MVNMAEMEVLFAAKILFFSIYISLLMWLIYRSVRIEEKKGVEGK